jgi:hypothetical protein
MEKLLEKLIRHYLQLHVDNADAIPHIQAGFRQSHSSETQFTNTIQAVLWEEKATCMVSIDCTEAFLSVSHQGIIGPPWLHNIISSFLEQR